MTGGVPGQDIPVWSLDRAAAVVTAPAEIDIANADHLAEVLAAALAEHGSVVVDMTGNHFCDSSGIRTLVIAHRRARAHGGEVRLVMVIPAYARCSN